MEEINNLKKLFDELDEEILIKLYLSDPHNLYILCMMYSLDIQMEKEDKIFKKAGLIKDL